MPWTAQTSGILDHAELKNVANGINGYGVLSGMALSVTGSSMVVTIASGVIKTASGSTTYAGGTVTLSNGDATNPRTDLVIWDDSANAPAVREGTPTAESSSQSKPPALDLADDNDIVLGKVYVAASATVIASNAVFQRRLLVPTNSTRVIKLNDETLTTDTTLQNDDELVVAVAANTSYFIQGGLIVASPTTADLKINFTAPSGATFTIMADYVASGTTLLSATTVSALTGIDGRGATTVSAVRFGGAVLTTGTAGNFQLQWAQNASSGTTTIHAGSWMEAITA